MSYGEYRPPRGEPVVQLHIGENAPQQYNVESRGWQRPSDWLHKEQAGVHRHGPIYLANIIDVGIFKDTIAPSFALHSGLAVIAWGVGRHYDRLEAKDWLWPSGQVINAWWSAVGKRTLVDGYPLSMVLKTISWPERLLLTGVTVWGTRSFYRIASKSLKRGKDDPRYSTVKKADGFWNTALITHFLPEALFHTIVTLPFTAPFRHQGGVMSGYHPVVQSLSVGLFSAGLVLEVLADYQRDKQQQEKPSELPKEGVWSIVRHPNYLGDVLMHASIPLLLFGSDMLAPIELLGPIANYVFLRYVDGDAASEASEADRYEAENPLKKETLAHSKSEKNAFWPAPGEIRNQWTWVVLGVGAGGILLERGLKALLH